MLHLRRRSYRRLGFGLLAIVLLAALVSGCGKKESKDTLPGAGEGTVIAKYDGGQVTQNEFDKYTAFLSISDPQTAMYMSIPQFKEQFVKQFVLYKVLADRASDEQKKKSKESADNFKTQLDTAMKDATNGPALKQEMDKQKITADEMYRIVTVLATYGEVMTAKETEIKATVKDADIKAVYDKAPADYNMDSVRHILVGITDQSTQKELRTDAEALARAKEVKAKLDAGGDWTELAKQYSDDTGSKDKGGLYEKTQAKGWVTEFKDAANKQEIGKIGDPVKTDYGYHVIMVVSREETPYDKLTQTDKDAIIKTITDPKVQAYTEDEEKKLNIKVTLPAEPSASPSASGSAAPTASPEASPSASASSSPSASK